MPAEPAGAGPPASGAASADARGPVRIGMGLLDSVPVHARARLLADAADAGIDAFVNWDHISFRGGWGTDGLVRSTADCALHPTIGVFVSVYLLTLRHPVLVARQLATLDEIAPGRIVLGVGVGGDDRHEMEICGVDPSTRGRRMEEHLTVLRALLETGEVSFQGEFVTLEGATIVPRPEVAIPLIVGGRSEAAIRRGGRLGDGWIGVWNSVEHYREAVALFAAEAQRAGRAERAWQHAIQIWCGIGPTHETARANVAASIESFVKLPFARFEPYCPAGRPEDIAAAAAPFIEAGCRHINFVACAADGHEAVEAVGAVARLLRGASPIRANDKGAPGLP